MSVSTNYDYSTSTVQQRAAADTESSRSSIDFLTLLIAQLTNQDPLSPMEDMDFTSQLAQLEQLEQQIQLTQTMTAMRQDTQVQSATAMIGKDITGVDSSGNTVSGTVVSVTQSGSDVFLLLGDGTQVPVGNVFYITGGETAAANDLASSANAIGMWVEAVDSSGEAVRGIIAEVGIVDGKVTLALYGGKTVTWDQVESMRVPTEDDTWYLLPDSVREKVELAQTLRGLVITGTTDAGEEITGIVSGAELHGYEVYIVLFDGTMVNIDALASEVKTPTAEDAVRDLIGLYAIGYDEEGNLVEGVIAGAEDRESGLAIILEDGSHIYYDALANITAVEEEAE